MRDTTLAEASATEMSTIVLILDINDTCNENGKLLTEGNFGDSIRDTVRVSGCSGGRGERCRRKDARSSGCHYYDGGEYICGVVDCGQG